MAKIIRIGDVFEVSTKLGFAYCQTTHRHPMYGSLIRAFPGFFEVQPENFSVLVQKENRFKAFFPLSAAVNRKIVRIVGNEAVPESAQQFPLFRTGVADPVTKKVANWWLWDGEREWQVGVLTPDQRKLSIRGVWNDTLLVERLESGWCPENDNT